MFGLNLKPGSRLDIHIETFVRAHIEIAKTLVGILKELNELNKHLRIKDDQGESDKE